MVELEVKARVRVPKVPNFILYEQSDGKISVGDLTDEQLAEIGELWTQDLLKRAAEVRAAR